MITSFFKRLNIYTDHPIDITSPTIGEIGIIIRHIRSGKAEGFENIPAEALKSHIKINANILHVLFRDI